MTGPGSVGLDEWDLGRADDIDNQELRQSTPAEPSGLEECSWDHRPS